MLWLIFCNFVHDLHIHITHKNQSNMIKFMNDHVGKVFCVAISVGLVGCIDENYDLSDIDTTVQIDVKDLVIPLNMSEMRLNSIIDLDDDGVLKEINGEYVIIQEGDLHSDEIKINSIEIDSPDGSLQSKSVTLAAGQAVKNPRYAHDFSYHTEGVDDYVDQIESAEVVWRIGMPLQTSSTDVVFRNPVYKIPEGLKGYPSVGVYDETTSTVTVTGDFHILDFSFNVTEIDCTANPDFKFDKEDHSIEFPGYVALVGGEIVNIGTETITGATVSVDFQFDVMTVKTITGYVHYQTDNLTSERIVLEDIPDYLSQPGTSLIMDNPQIYITASNPLASYGVTASTGIVISQYRADDNGDLDSISGIEMPEPLRIGAVEGAQSFCLSPDDPGSQGYDKFPDAVWHSYPGLGRIVYGEGLPQELGIYFQNPGMDHCYVTKFEVGKNLGELKGTYTLYAPLAMEAGSQVRYSGRETGWGLENDLTVTTLQLTASVSSTLPVNVHVEAWPLDMNGERISNVEIKGADVAAGTSTDLNITITGEIAGLDGIEYVAKVISGDNTAGITLKPSQGLDFSGIRIKVSGHYRTEI